MRDRPGHDRRYAIDNFKLRRELGWVMWQHLLEQIYERIRPASLDSTGLGSCSPGSSGS